MAKLQRICVYCASSPGRNAAITAATRTLGQHFVDEGIELVYGGGSVGLMGLLADTVMDGGGRVTGVIPSRLFPKEIPHPNLSELVEVGSMHERKTRMFELSDGFIALPGGFGTLEEVAEVTTWAQLGLHQKPIGLLNVDGYYDALIAFLQRGVDEQLLRDGARSLLLSADDPAAMLTALREYEAPPRPRWLDLAQT